MTNSLVDSFFVAIFKGIFLLILFSPVLIYRHFKNKKDRANGIDPDAIEKQEQTKKDKEDHDKFFKGQGY